MQAVSLIGLSTLFVVMWSSGWVASQLAISELDLVTLLLVRYLMVLLTLIFMVSLLKLWRRMSLSEVLQQMLVGSLVHGIYLMAALSAFEEGVSAGLVAFIMTLHPMLTATLSARVNGETVSARQWQGLLFGTLAIIMTVSDSYRHGASGAALMLPFLAVLALTVGSLLNRHLELSHKAHAEHPQPVLLILLLQSAGALLVLLPMRDTSVPLQFDTFTAEEWQLLMWLAFVVSLGAYAVLQLLLRRISTTRVASLGYLIPPATMVQTYLVFGDKLSIIDVAGLAVASIGVYLVMTPERARLPTTESHTDGSTRPGAVMVKALNRRMDAQPLRGGTAVVDIEL